MWNEWESQHVPPVQPSDPDSAVMVEVDELEDGVGQQPDETTQPAAMGLLLG